MSASKDVEPGAGLPSRPRRISESGSAMTADELPRTLVVLDSTCGLDAFERVLADSDPDATQMRLIVRSSSTQRDDLSAAHTLLREATKLAYRYRFVDAGGAIVRNSSDLAAELTDSLGYDESVIIMPESQWPVTHASRLRRTAKRYSSLVRFDCVDAARPAESDRTT